MGSEAVKIAITGATGVIGRAAVRALVADGHDVFGLSRSARNESLLESLGAVPVAADLFDVDSLAALFSGCDAALNFATHIPAGYSAVLPSAWRDNDRLRTQGVACVVEAARLAGVRRLVQESVSFLYVDNGDGWITEKHPIDITRATEPASVGESHVQDYACDSRQGVVLRFGTIIGDDPLTRWMLRSARRGRPVAAGRPEAWSHVIHGDDLGSAVVAALSAPSGVYNVGAAPVRRDALAQGYAEAVGRDSAALMGPLLTRLAGPRLEPLSRSLRVSSEAFTAATGWAPLRSSYDASWFDVVDRSSV